MRIKRNRSKGSPSWLRRFWDWFLEPFRQAGDDEEVYLPEAPQTLPPKDPGWQPQGELFKMLSNRNALLSGNGGAKESLRVYEYCGVVFYKADNVYHYLNPGLALRVGDRVLAPVHIHGKTELAEGVVVSTGEYLAQCVPYPVGQTSTIVRKL